MAFWGGAKLLDKVEKQNIVTPFDSGKIDCSAYTLTLGAEAFVTPSYGDDLRENLKKTLAEPVVETFGDHQSLRGGGTIVIPPGQFAFLLTEEVVSIPKNVMGFISLKSKAKFRGLINVSGFHVDPGFTGRLIYSVFNAGPAALHLSRGDNLFLLWLADLSGKTEEPFYKTGSGYVEIPSDLVSDVSRETHSLQALSDQLTTISEQFRTIKNVAGGVAVSLGLIVAFLALKPVFWDDSPAPTLVDAKVQTGQVGGTPETPLVDAKPSESARDQAAGADQSSTAVE